jgi:hypothetical protein
MSRVPPTMPGTSARREEYPPVVGSAAITSLPTVVCCRALCTSTIGVSPVTTMVSSSAPTFRSALTDAVNDPVSSTPSRLIVLNPGRVNVTV